MKGMRIALSEFQREMLQPFFDEVKEENKSGKPCGIVAQIWEGKKGVGFLDVRLIDHETCKAVQAATGQIVGARGEKEVDVLVPTDE